MNNREAAFYGAVFLYGPPTKCSRFAAGTRNKYHLNGTALCLLTILDALCSHTKNLLNLPHSLDAEPGGRCYTWVLARNPLL